MLATEGFLAVAGKQLEYRWLPAQAKSNPTLVFLHEGLGCVELWRDFPDQIAQTTGLGALVYSRAAYGASDPEPRPWPLTYMHHEALTVLPELLHKAAVQNPILIGHSDGASIALIYAGSKHQHQHIHPQGLVLIAPHVFAEKIGLQAIQAAGELYQTGNLKAKLARYHRHVDNAFYGWHDTWLSEKFEHWNIEAYANHIRCPSLLIQGEQDAYGTAAQITSISSRLTNRCQTYLLADCGHTPQKDQTAITVAHITAFVNSVLP